MTSTLVLGASPATRFRYAVSLLSSHDRVTLVSAHATPEGSALAQLGGLPEGWAVVETLDLTRALLAARGPVLVDDLPTWVGRVLDEQQLWDDPGAARAQLDGLGEEVGFALAALPFPTVAISQEVDRLPVPDAGLDRRAPLLAELVELVNLRVSAASSHVHEIRGGRVLDLSDGRAVPQA